MSEDDLALFEEYLAAEEDEKDRMLQLMSDDQLKQFKAWCKDQEMEILKRLTGQSRLH